MNTQIFNRAKKIAAWLLITAMAAACLAGCSGPGSSGDNSNPANQRADSSSGENTGNREPAEETSRGTIAITYVKSPLNVPSIVEREQHIFADAFRELGYEVSYSELTTGPEQTQALASGDIQFLYAVGAASVILSAAGGADIRIISAYSRSPQAFRLFSKDGSITSPEDLKGKKIAGPKGTILHELLVAYLKSANMTEADIEFLSMGIPDSQAALAGGSVDAALLAGPTAYNMEKEGYPVVTDGEGLTEATIVVAVSGAYAEAHPDEVETFLQAQKTVLDYMKTNEKAAMEATAAETELSMEAVEEMYPMYDFDMTIRDSDIEAMKKTEAFMRENQMIDNPVDIEELIWDER